MKTLSRVLGPSWLFLSVGCLSVGCSAGAAADDEAMLSEIEDTTATEQLEEGMPGLDELIEDAAEQALGEGEASPQDADEGTEFAQTEQALWGIGETNWVGCNDTRKSDVTIVKNTIGNNWSSYERFVEAETGLNIGDCLRKRFQKNGLVHCDWEYRHGCTSTTWGTAKYSMHTAHMCRNFLRDVDTKSSGVNRRASYAALLAHEWGHTCWRNESNADKIDVATFNWYKSRYAVTDSTCISCTN